MESDALQISTRKQFAGVYRLSVKTDRGNRKIWVYIYHRCKKRFVFIRVTFLIFNDYIFLTFSKIKNASEIAC